MNLCHFVASLFFLLILKLEHLSLSLPFDQSVFFTCPCLISNPDHCSWLAGNFQVKLLFKQRESHAKRETNVIQNSVHPSPSQQEHLVFVDVYENRNYCQLSGNTLEQHQLNLTFRYGLEWISPSFAWTGIHDIIGSEFYFTMKILVN
jgi:hypothetical protein